MIPDLLVNLLDHLWWLSALICGTALILLAIAALGDL